MNRAFLVYNISKMLAEYEDSQDKTTNLNVKIMENAEKKFWDTLYKLYT